MCSTKFTRQISKLSCYGMYIAIVCNFIILLLVLAEIFFRTFFNTSLLITYELTEWLLLTFTFMGGAWTLRNGGHVRINIVTKRLSLAVQSLISGFLASIGAVTCTVFAWYAWLSLVEKYSCNIVGTTVFRTPVWYAWVPLVLGNILLGLEFLGIAIENIIVFNKKRKDIKSLRKGLYQWMIWFFCILLIIIFSLHYLSYIDVNIACLLSIVLLILFSFVGASLWIFLSLALTGIIGLLLFTGYPVGGLVSEIAFSACSSFVLVCLPMFIFMGELLFNSGMSKDLYSGMAFFVNRIPGGLLHSNVLSCTVFAAISGSSAVTTAFVGSVAVPELKRLGYDKSITLGSLAGGWYFGVTDSSKYSTNCVWCDEYGIDRTTVPCGNSSRIDDIVNVCDLYWCSGHSKTSYCTCDLQ